MASRPHTTYKKRQKELARMEKQRDKAAKRIARKLEKGTGERDEDGPLDGAESPLDGTESIYDGEDSPGLEAGDATRTDEPTP